jgi:hypothetical protein
LESYHFWMNKLEIEDINMYLTDLMAFSRTILKSAVIYFLIPCINPRSKFSCYLFFDSWSWALLIGNVAAWFLVQITKLPEANRGTTSVLVYNIISRQNSTNPWPNFLQKIITQPSHGTFPLRHCGWGIILSTFCHSKHFIAFLKIFLTKFIYISTKRQRLRAFPGSDDMIVFKNKI